jgi:hypothetical protein
VNDAQALQFRAAATKQVDAHGSDNLERVRNRSLASHLIEWSARVQVMVLVGSAIFIVIVTMLHVIGKARFLLKLPPAAAGQII